MAFKRNAIAKMPMTRRKRNGRSAFVRSLSFSGRLWDANMRLTNAISVAARRGRLRTAFGCGRVIKRQAPGMLIKSVTETRRAFSLASVQLVERSH